MVRLPFWPQWIVNIMKQTSVIVAHFEHATASQKRTHAPNTTRTSHLRLARNTVVGL